MNLENPITITPPPVTDNNGKLLVPPPMTLERLNVTYHDNPDRRTIWVTIQNIPNSMILLQDAEYDKLGDYKRSDLEAALKNHLKNDADKKIRAMFPKTLEENPDGPGTVLSKMLSKIGIKSTANCACRRHAIEMNEKGNDWCEQNVPTILAWLKEESGKRNLPFIETAAKLMVQRAIKKSRKLLKQSND